MASPHVRIALLAALIAAFPVLAPAQAPATGTGPPSQAQAAPAPPGAAPAATRAARIEAARDAKASELRPETVSGLERVLLQVKERKVLERLTYPSNGVGVGFGSMATGSGFAIGPRYLRDDLADGRLRLHASAAISTRAWQKYVAGLTVPHLASDRLSVGVEAVRRDYRSLEFYGVGPDSAEGSRSTYRLRDTTLEATVAFQPIQYFRVGGSVGGLWTDIGAGRRSGLPSTDAAFTDSSAPGLGRQADYFVPAVFAQVDYRDNPAGPKSGGNYAFEHTWYSDRSLGDLGFRRWDVDLQQYVGFFNKTRRLALRARFTMTDAGAGRRVPFYLQPFVGGSDDLRGFRPFRFTDRNAVVYNAEYRWEVFSGLDGALFLDAGKVAPRGRRLNLSDLEISPGFGLRFNARNRTFIRLDVGFSDEGVGVWLKFNDAFLPRLFGAGTRQPRY